MLEFRTGDLLKDDSEAVVNTVNCVGIMGRGIALQFKNTFPENFKAYKDACDRDEVQPGVMFVFETGNITPPRFIINFPTKRHWRGASRMEDVESGLVDLVKVIRELGIQSIAIPPLGSGLGGLHWPDVRKRIEGALAELPEVRVRVYEPHQESAPPMKTKSQKVPKMTAGRAALVELIRRYQAGLLDPYVTLLEIHKLMYFMQEAGEQLRLEFKPHHYGPYAENLRHVLHAIEGYFIAGYADGGDSPTKRLNLVPGAAEEAEAFLAKSVETRRRYERVSDLVAGFESPLGLELLSTVHWVATRKGLTDVEMVTNEVHNWSERKKQFTQRQVGIAYEFLQRKGWLENQGAAGEL